MKNNSYSPMIRALPWFIVGMFVCGLIIFYGTDYQQQRNSWPLHKAEVIETKITWGQYMTDEYMLSIILSVRPEGKAPFQTSLAQVGPKGALEGRAKHVYANGRLIEVRINPRNTNEVVLNNKGSWGIYLVGILTGLFIVSNGFTILNNK